MNYHNFTKSFSNSSFTLLSEYGYEDYYIIFPTGEVYNTKTKQPCKMRNHCYTLKRKSGEFQTITLRNLYQKVYNEYFYIDTIEDLPGEEWRKTEESTKHFVSNRGRIKSIEGYRAKLLKPRLSNKGYYRVSIKGKEYLLHRLIAKAFVANPDPENKVFIDHIDENKINNNVENLQWVSRSENMRLHYERIRQKRDNK